MVETITQADLFREVEPGMEVWSRDGQRLGRVGERAARCLKLDIRFARDHWLSARHIAYVDPSEQRVVMAFGGQEEKHFRVPAPRRN